MENETVWLTQSQIALLFGCSSDNVSLHLKNLYDEGEIEQVSTTEEISVVRAEGKRRVTRRITHYNLDAILSVGYRVNSKNATLFRKWATKTLKEHILGKYAVNQRIERLRHITQELSSDLERHNQQYPSITITESSRYHDRFLIIDTTVYHIGASLKDLGKKLFAFSKMEVPPELFVN